MAAEWGMGYGMGAVPTSSGGGAPAYGLYGMQPTIDTWRVDDLLDFSNHDDLYGFPPSSASGETHHTHTNNDTFYGCPTAIHGGDSFTTRLNPNQITSSFSDDLYIPEEEVADLEWLSRFVDDSFSDIPRPSYMNHVAAAASNAKQVRKDPTSRAARSKRCKGGGGGGVAGHNGGVWGSFTPPSTTQQQQLSPSSSSTSSSDFPERKEKECVAGGVRRCTHCSSEKTPQWRTGPMGPKTLCNACGVRYKSGRLVPEYRPAASPTFVLTQHSNSHRKVMELRRQKEMVLLHPSTAAAVPDGGELIFRDYGVC